MAFGGVHPFMLKAAGDGGGGGGGDLFSVTPCAGGARVLCDDPYGAMPAVDDIVIYDGNTACGTVYSTGQGGTADYDLDEIFDGNCSECESSLGGPGGP